MLICGILLILRAKHRTCLGGNYMATYTKNHDEFLSGLIEKKICISFIDGTSTHGILRRFDDLCLIVHHPIENGDVGTPWDDLHYRHSIRSIRPLRNH